MLRSNGRELPYAGRRSDRTVESRRWRPHRSDRTVESLAELFSGRSELARARRSTWRKQTRRWRACGAGSADKASSDHRAGSCSRTAERTGGWDRRAWRPLRSCRPPLSSIEARAARGALEAGDAAALPFPRGALLLSSPLPVAWD